MNIKINQLENALFWSPSPHLTQTSTKERQAFRRSVPNPVCVMASIFTPSAERRRSMPIVQIVSAGQCAPIWGTNKHFKQHLTVISQWTSTRHCLCRLAAVTWALAGRSPNNPRDGCTMRCWAGGAGGPGAAGDGVSQATAWVEGHCDWDVDGTDKTFALGNSLAWTSAIRPPYVPKGGYHFPLSPVNQKKRQQT